MKSPIYRFWSYDQILSDDLNFYIYNLNYMYSYGIYNYLEIQTTNAPIVLRWSERCYTPAGSTQHLNTVANLHFRSLYICPIHCHKSAICIQVLATLVAYDVISFGTVWHACSKSILPDYDNDTTTRYIKLHVAKYSRKSFS